MLQNEFVTISSDRLTNVGTSRDSSFCDIPIKLVPWATHMGTNQLLFECRCRCDKFTLNRSLHHQFIMICKFSKRRQLASPGYTSQKRD
ncbi:hypothetical protein EG68_01399 [Paragonimus skrjabini miyazakii]|uniref:Uncharacterized protein n=1 Tax=Paragonimus skrjabini miyazakii TaxID=59628 RepID=A0A8S9YZQ3_9TREM|nr:hypothetical protein EG68_01399 [Paragonimus skrjabini miyazakii]